MKCNMQFMQKFILLFKVITTSLIILFFLSLLFSNCDFGMGGGKLKILLQSRSDSISGAVRVYYKDLLANAFSDDNSINQLVKTNNNSYELEYAIKTFSALSELRLDFDITCDQFEIISILFNENDILADVTVKNSNDVFVNKGKTASLNVIKSNSVDPYIVLSCPSLNKLSKPRSSINIFYVLLDKIYKHFFIGFVVILSLHVFFLIFLFKFPSCIKLAIINLTLLFAIVLSRILSLL